MRCYTDYCGMAQAEAEREAGIDVYRDYADILAARQAGAGPDPLALSAPMAEEGARGMAFVEAALSSHAEGGGRLDFQPEI
jgi:hypothetical protein